MNEFLALEEDIVKMLRTVFDPEIPVNVYDLGLIYKVDIGEGGNVSLDMTTSNAIRTLSNFAIEKIIAVDGRKIKIIDEERLRKISKIG